MPKNSIAIVEILKEVMFSDKIRVEYKMNDKDFSRKRKQPFGEVLLFMLFNLLRKSLAIEIDSFTNYLNSKLESEPIKNFTKGAFVQKRQKINPDVFKYLSRVITDNTYVQRNKNVQLFLVTDYLLLMVP